MRLHTHFKLEFFIPYAKFPTILEILLAKFLFSWKTNTRGHFIFINMMSGIEPMLKVNRLTETVLLEKGNELLVFLLVWTQILSLPFLLYWFVDYWASGRCLISFRRVSQPQKPLETSENHENLMTWKLMSPFFRKPPRKYFYGNLWKC